MTLRKVVIALTFISVFAMGLRISTDNDTWWHLRTGDWIREHGQIPREDPFSFTREGADWRYPSAAWISQTAMSFVYEQSGPAGLNLGLAAIVSLALALLYSALDGGVFLRAFILILTAASSAVFWSARPHLATYVFFAGFVAILKKTNRGQNKLLWWLPLLMLIWVNSHPGFAAGFIVYAVYLIGAAVDLVEENWGRERREIWQAARSSRLPHMALIGALLVPVVALNPSGPRMFSYPFETLSIGPLRDFIQEWQSPNFHDGANLPFLFSVMLAIVILGLSRRRITATEGLLLTIFGAMAFLAGRNIALFALVSAPILARHLSAIINDWQEKGLRRLELDQRPNRSQSALNVAIIVTALLALALKAGQVLPEAANQQIFEERFPVKAVAFIRNQNLQGPIFNSYNFGGYLIWALPEQPVFIDGRTDLYDDGSLERWLEIAAAKEGWQRRLTEYQVNLVLIEDSWPVAHRLEAEGWDKIYADEVASIFINH